MFCNEFDFLEFNVGMLQDEEFYDYVYFYKFLVMYCNGCLIIFGFGLFLMKNFRLLFYFVDLDIGNFRILYLLLLWFSEMLFGIIMFFS